MTVAASLSISARPSGMRARIAMFRWKPILMIDDEVIELDWLAKQRHVLTPGTHTLTMALARGDERAADTTTQLQAGPGEFIHVGAFFRPNGTWQFDVMRKRPDYGTDDRAN